MTIAYHEPTAELTPETRDAHRVLSTLVEEFEAIDWYNQRIDVASDNELKGLLAHNRDEEMEHAAMALEWLRRNLPAFDEKLQTYLFTGKPILAVEEEDQAGDGPGGAQRTAGRSLNIGSLRKGGFEGEA